MEQNESQKNDTGKNTNAQNDRRTFFIAFLTTVILLALYHFSTGLFAIFSGTSDFCTIPVTREYVLVPVSSMPHAGPGMMGSAPGFHGMRHGGMKRMGGPGGNNHAHDAEHGPHRSPVPAPEEPAPETPAE